MGRILGGLDIEMTMMNNTCRCIRSVNGCSTGHRALTSHTHMRFTLAGSLLVMSLQIHVLSQRLFQQLRVLFTSNCCLMVITWVVTRGAQATKQTTHIVLSCELLPTPTALPINIYHSPLLPTLPLNLNSTKSSRVRAGKTTALLPSERASSRFLRH